MQIVVHPGNVLSGETRLPGDKSISHRAAILAALAVGESCVENYLVAGVTRAMLEGLRACGVHWRLDGSTLTVSGSGLRGWSPPEKPIDCGNSATTMRLFAGALVATGLAATLDGSPSLRRRPMQRIIQPLQAMGAVIQSENGRAPLVIQANVQPLQAIEYSLPVASAQVKTCLMLAGLGAEGLTTLHEPGPSRDHTERMLRSMGVQIEKERAASAQGTTAYTTRMVKPEGHELAPLNMVLPGDISAASFLIVAALITPGSRLGLKDVLLNPTRLGLLDALEMMGASIVRTERQERCGEPVGDLVIKHSRLTGIEVSGSLVVRMIDEFPAFAVACAYAQGRTVVRDAEELRYKESDRIATLCSELRSLGCDAQEQPDGFVITGGSVPSGGQAYARGDHRLAMALALVGLASKQPVQVMQAELIKESFPGFVDILRSFGCKIEVLEE